MLGKLALFTVSVMKDTTTHTLVPLVSENCVEKSFHLISMFALFFILGIDFKQKLINLDGVPIKLQIWDVSNVEMKIDEIS